MFTKVNITVPPPWLIVFKKNFQAPAVIRNHMLIRNHFFWETPVKESCYV